MVELFLNAGHKDDEVSENPKPPYTDGKASINVYIANAAIIIVAYRKTTASMPGNFMGRKCAIRTKSYRFDTV